MKVAARVACPAASSTRDELPMCFRVFLAFLRCSGVGLATMLALVLGCEFAVAGSVEYDRGDSRR